MLQQQLIGLLAVETKMFEELDDHRETVEIELSDEEFLIIAKRAHERDITFNKMIEEILWEALNHLQEEENGSTT